MAGTVMATQATQVTPAQVTPAQVTPAQVTPASRAMTPK
eukprot:CAMPEP_0170465798 /NCGR_PEP_ID=MMETSP0123-20130129/10001_1 /TAXON_ID=182087 /ORGANISM="Favella ehrenbergii, Strain Fehren 1" /LENGTH=38 /DNA_ID= /DNA_START= /DNA_END= /DNA_ORIENTATION=